jgi:transposase
MLIEIAHAICQEQDWLEIEEILHQNKSRRRTKIAIVALARKVLYILHHLLIHREEYQEKGVRKSKCLNINHSTVAHETSLDEMIQILINTGYTVEN